MYRRNRILVATFICCEFRAQCPPGNVPSMVRAALLCSKPVLELLTSLSFRHCSRLSREYREYRELSTEMS